MLDLWYNALHSQFGIVIQTDNPSLVKQKLYRARSESGDLALGEISICASPLNPSTEIWLVKKKPDAAQGRSPTSEGNVEPV